MAQASTLTSDEIRATLGLPRTLWATLLDMDYKPAEIVDLMHEFQDEIRSELDREFRRPIVTIDGEPYLSTIQASRALSIGDFHLSNLRDRGKLVPHSYGRRVVYSRAALEDLFVLDDSGRFVLANAFMRWMRSAATV